MKENIVARTRKKHFTLWGESEEELARRIQTFERALSMRYGSILRIKPKLPTASRSVSAIVYYQLSLANLYGSTCARRTRQRTGANAC